MLRSVLWEVQIDKTMDKVRIQAEATLINIYMNVQAELMLKVAIAAVGAYIASHLIYRLALEVWCIAYGLIY